MAFIVYEPGATTPATTGMEPYSGTKLLASFAATTPANDDWIISPELNFAEPFTFSFRAKTYMDDYGIERIKALYSTTDSIKASFTHYLAGSAMGYL